MRKLPPLLAEHIPAGAAAPAASATIIAPRRSGRSRTSALPRAELSEGMSMDQSLEELKGDW